MARFVGFTYHMGPVWLFFLILYVPVSNFSIISGWVFLGLTSTKQRIKCLAQGHDTVQPARLQPATPRSRVKHSTTEPLHSIYGYCEKTWFCCMSTTKVLTSLHIRAGLISNFVIRSLKSILAKLYTCNMSIFELVSVAIQARLNLTWAAFLRPKPIST